MARQSRFKTGLESQIPKTLPTDSLKQERRRQNARSRKERAAREMALVFDGTVAVVNWPVALGSVDPWAGFLRLLRFRIM